MEKSYFNHKKSQFWPYARVVRHIRRKFIVIPVTLAAYAAGALSSAYLLFTFVLTKIDVIPYIDQIPPSNTVVGLSFIFISIALLALSFHIYYKSAVEQPTPKHTAEQALKKIEEGAKLNIAHFCSTALLITIDDAASKSKTKDKNLVEAKELYKALSDEERGVFVIKRMGLQPKEFLQKMEEFYASKDQQYKSLVELDTLMRLALQIAAIETHPKILVSDMLAALSQQEPFLKNFLFEKNIKFEDVLNMVYWQTTNEVIRLDAKFNPDRPKLTGGIGKEWAMGYALALQKYAFDLTMTVQRQQSPIHLIGRKQETEQMEKILVRASKHNVLLVGPSGVGKNTIVMNFARRVLYGNTYPALSNRKIMELNIDYMLAGAGTPGQIIERLNAVLTDAVKAGNIILYINNVHSLFAGGGSNAKVGAIDASDILIPYLENPELFFITTTSTSDYHQYIEPKSGIVDKFERIDVPEQTKESTIRILEDILHWMEPHYKIIVTYNALQKIVDLSDRFIYDKSFPEKAIDILNEVVVYAKTHGKNVVEPKDIEQVISAKTKVPIGEGEKAEKERLLNLEEFLHRRVIGQDLAINAVSDALRRARSGIRKGHKPIGSFLFLGPTGVGKTETSKALAESFFGSEERMIRFDMSEYQDITGLYRLLGAPPGTPEAQNGGQLTNAVKDAPYSLVLFDEIEKADPNILNIFLQLLDEGWVTDSLGRRVKFNNTIIIATSNAGSDYIRKQIQAGTSPQELQEGLLNYLQEKRLFRPEFLNRFTAVVNFHPLNRDQVLQITEKMVKSLVKRVYDEKGVQLTVTPAAMEKLAEIGYDPLLGARPINRAIQDKVENFLAKKLLSDSVKRGEVLVFDVQDIT